ncbi:MAG: hypothetical protein H0W08_23030 [Acidobacteria bacterium]|nr:hypothetical protein [Acidobacteriota bacterium]
MATRPARRPNLARQGMIPSCCDSGGGTSTRALSFAVYLIPLVTAHWFSIVGGYLVSSSRRRSAESPAWVLSEFAVVVSRFGHELLTLPDGWISWDTYVEDRRYALAWSRAGQVARRELARGLAFTSLAVDARGEFVAVSATSGLRIGSQQDEVWLVRTSDGAELFRRYSPKYSRATVALPAGRFFAVSEIAGARSSVRIHRLLGDQAP